MKRPEHQDLERQIEGWNQSHPVGTSVDYHPVIGEAKARRTKTRSRAFILSGHTACCFVESEPGCVALDALTVAAEGSAA